MITRREKGILMKIFGDLESFPLGLTNSANLMLVTQFYSKLKFPVKILKKVR